MQLVDPLAGLLPVVLTMLLVPVGIKLSLIDILQGQVPALARPPASGVAKGQAVVDLSNQVFIAFLQDAFRHAVILKGNLVISLYKIAETEGIPQFIEGIRVAGQRCLWSASPTRPKA